MLFSEATENAGLIARAGPDVDVRRVEYDSRRVEPGSVFVAMRGGSVDGNRFIDAAVAAGAVAIITDDAERFAALQARGITRSAERKLAVGLTDHGRKTLALAAANLLGHPERKLALTGVTGTNGKTTTTHILDAILTAAGRKTVLVGTIAYRVAGKVMPSPHTTPEASDLLELLAAGAEVGATEAVMEVSSHALAQGRVWGIPFEVAVFTNLTRDHLDFHGSMEAYFEAKKRLFLPGERTAAPKFAIVNVEDEAGREIARESGDGESEVWTYGVEQGDFHAEQVEMSAKGTKFFLVSRAGSVGVRSRLVGRVNVLNTLAAAGAAVARGLTLQQVAVGLASMSGVPGRFELVDAGQPFAVVVDYAHTDDALRNLTALARELVAPHGGRVITLFGCGGDRDRTKRPLMARAAAEGSDFVVLTSDNPRSEDPWEILRDAEAGFAGAGYLKTRTEYAVIEDRAEAIAAAIGRASKGDIVLLAGKGHEKTQTTRDGVLPFDDVAVARAAVERIVGVR
jgi:UDP-N-acetylmuramoyl-L-alanyl-D-glutamate--2,6-diaminopimelate ligase